MANLVVTTTTNSVVVAMNAYYPSVIQTEEALWDKCNVSLHKKEEYILVNIEHEKEWKVAAIEDLPEKILSIDSVNGTNVSTLNELWTALKAAFV